MIKINPSGLKIMMCLYFFKYNLSLYVERAKSDLIFIQEMKGNIIFHTIIFMLQYVGYTNKLSNLCHK